VRPRATDPKIKDSHLSRLAVIYIRRSSPYMVEEHTASGMHQRTFKELARAYGWEEHLIIEIDEAMGEARRAPSSVTDFSGSVSRSSKGRSARFSAGKRRGWLGTTPISLSCSSSAPRATR
jgi:hypothetical protein